MHMEPDLALSMGERLPVGCVRDVFSHRHWDSDYLAALCNSLATMQQPALGFAGFCFHRIVCSRAASSSPTTCWVSARGTTCGVGDALGEQRCTQIELVSADMASWISGPIAERIPHAVRCVDPFHVVKLATEALDQVRREVWNEARRQGNLQLAREMKGARFAVWKNPENLTDRQQAKLATIQHTNAPAVPRVPAQGTAAPDLPGSPPPASRTARRLAELGASIHACRHS